MDGFELMAELKRQDEDLRVILMTGSIYELDEHLTRALREKAFYYINKPFDREVLRTLVARAVELRELEDAARQHTEHLESQLEEARIFQETMLPARETSLNGFTIRAAYRPCTELAGDLYDYAPAGEGRIAVVVADVVGHGVSAAMLTAVVKSAFHRARDAEYEPAAVVARVAEQVRAFQADRFVTLLAARLSPGRLEYVNAGHEGALLLAPGRPPEALESTGPIASPVIAGKWSVGTRDWAPECGLLIYTDGITETLGEDRFFERERLIRVAASGSLDDLNARILEEIESFAAGRPADDDQTLVLVRSD
jgi:sigma-B regulation protein RsbU (phosphoserine phosphatase)